MYICIRTVIVLHGPPGAEQAPAHLGPGRRPRARLAAAHLVMINMINMITSIIIIIIIVSISMIIVSSSSSNNNNNINHRQGNIISNIIISLHQEVEGREQPASILGPGGPIRGASARLLDRRHGPLHRPEPLGGATRPTLLCLTRPRLFSNGIACLIWLIIFATVFAT